MPEVMRYWVQDKNPDTTQKAAELAEEFVARRSSQKDDTPERKFPGARGDYRGKYYKPRSEEDKREPKDSVKGAHRSRAAGDGEAGEENHRAEKQGRADETTKKQFEARKPMRCFRCNETGHMAAGCRKPRVVFSYLSKDDENDRLLEPYLHDLLVNGEPCKVLRDCAAPLDVVHPSLVQADHYTAPQEGSCDFDWGDTCGYSVGNGSGLWQLNHWKASDNGIGWNIAQDVTVGHDGGFAIFKPSLGTNPVGVLSSPKVRGHTGRQCLQFYYYVSQGTTNNIPHGLRVFVTGHDGARLPIWGLSGDALFHKRWSPALASFSGGPTIQVQYFPRFSTIES
ncbi:uncharacterized protein ISCGN_022368 [Ixodes scapularis]